MELNCDTYPNVFRYDNPPNMTGIRNLQQAEPHHTIHTNCLGAPLTNINYLDQQMGNARISSASTGLVHNNITEGFSNINITQSAKRLLLATSIAIVMYYLYITYFE